MGKNNLPVFFIGHGSPLNALEDNPFTRNWRELFTALDMRAVLFISAHWLTVGSYVTAAPEPETIHDFSGFPAELYHIRYPAPGSPEIAQEICNALAFFTAEPDTRWGLDHGTWSILLHALPDARIPVLQLSIDLKLEAQDYFRIGQLLRPLRQEGILICGSGNIVHNLKLLDWTRLDRYGYAFDWAAEADAIVKECLQERQWHKLVEFRKLPHSVQLAINSGEHFVPLLYILGAAYPEEPLRIFNDVAIGGALTMTSVQLG
ncbi:MAG: 4,5-DOPA dioxygenase extradiol [Turneriella sp.]|nr:4,5-DOPA dioxygenase extradiol [Turneriella sp.]